MAASLEQIEIKPQETQARILIAASDAEATGRELLDQDAQVLRTSLARLNRGDAIVETLATLDQQKFARLLENFKPNAVVFSARGSAQPYIRMLDPHGWIRQISAVTLSKLFSQANSQISLLMLLNCMIFREISHVAAFSKYLLSVRSLWRTHELPFDIEAQVFATLAGRFDTLDAYASAIGTAASRTAFAEFEIKVAGPESQEFARTLGLETFDSWSPIDSIESAESISSYGELGTRGWADAAASQVERPGPRIYRVWYGTNREPAITNGTIHFGSERANKITYGYCDVSIPKYHVIGTVGESWWKRFPKFWENNRLTVREIKQLDQVSYWASLQKVFAELHVDERVLLVFIHGYNVSFKEAAIRAAQIGFDLNAPGATSFFSWPSKGTTVGGYPADEATIEVAVEYISTFVDEMCEYSGAEIVHIVAHSMGNRGLLRTFCSMSGEIRNRVKAKVDQIILAAPDVDTDLFKQLAAVYPLLCNRTTMYVSSKDLALYSSGLVHDYARAGYIPPVTVIDGIDTIEVSNIDLTFLGHGYIAETRAVLADMYALMTLSTPPGDRFGLEAAKTETGEDYWIVRA